MAGMGLPDSIKHKDCSLSRRLRQVDNKFEASLNYIGKSYVKQDTILQIKKKEKQNYRHNRHKEGRGRQATTQWWREFVHMYLALPCLSTKLALLLVGLLTFLL